MFQSALTLEFIGRDDHRKWHLAEFEFTCNSYSDMKYRRWGVPSYPPGSTAGRPGRPRKPTRPRPPFSPFGFTCNRRGCRSRGRKRSISLSPDTVKRGFLCNRRGGCRSKRIDGGAQWLHGLGQLYSQERVEENVARMCLLWRCNSYEDLNVRQRVVCDSLGCHIQPGITLGRNKRKNTPKNKFIGFGCNKMKYCFGFNAAIPNKDRREDKLGVEKGVYKINFVYQKQAYCDGPKCYRWAGFKTREMDKTAGQCSKPTTCGSHTNRTPDYHPVAGTITVDIDVAQMMLKWSCTNDNKCSAELYSMSDLRQSSKIVQVTKLKGYAYVIPGYKSLFSLDFVCVCETSPQCECCGTKTYTATYSRRYSDTEQDTVNIYQPMAADEDLQPAYDDPYMPYDEDETMKGFDDDIPESRYDDPLSNDDESGKHSDQLESNYETNYIAPVGRGKPEDSYVPALELSYTKPEKEGKWLEQSPFGLALMRRQGCNFGQNCYWNV